MISDRISRSLQERVNGTSTTWGKYAQHKRDAKKRCVVFSLTFFDWVIIWVSSGHFHERGVKRGQYVMARFNDVGPYSVENVEIILCEQNHADGNIGKPRPKNAEYRKKISTTMSGRKLSSEHRQAIGNSVRGKRRNLEQRRVASEIMKEIWKVRRARKLEAST